MWDEDPDGVGIVLVEMPAGHPLRRDPRPAIGVAAATTYRMPHDRAFHGNA
jgi:hypothetical protein